jgi:anti-sigma factor RsiW
MNCEEARKFLDSYVDGELDLVNHLGFEEHVEACDACDREYQGRVALKGAITADRELYFRAPSDLQKRISASLRDQDEEKREPFFKKWLGWRWTPALVTAALLVAMLSTAFIALRPAAETESLLVGEIVSAHVRSLMLDHATDVVSTDQHTVKPWFEGKLDFSPPVVDLAQQGFPLAGGRLDYAGGRAVAALVYQRRQHIINVFIYPIQDTKAAPGATYSRQGFNVVQWTKNGMTFWAVSDLNAAELQGFAQLLQNN